MEKPIYILNNQKIYIFDIVSAFFPFIPSSFIHIYCDIALFYDIIYINLWKKKRKQVVLARQLSFVLRKLKKNIVFYKYRHLLQYYSSS